MQDEIVDFYAGYDERGRLGEPHSIERLRSQEIILRFLTKEPCRILDVGGAAGIYSFWLAGLGHRVTLLDLSPKHIEQAREADAKAARRLESLVLGNALDLPFAEGSFDAVLLMGPLYHLLDRGMRIRALREALRVLKAGGVLVFAVISRFASLMDGLADGIVADPAFRKILDRDLETGDHVNDSGNGAYFTTAHLHSLDEIRSEAADAGVEGLEILAVEGLATCMGDSASILDDPVTLAYVLEKIRQTEREGSVLGASSHLMGVARKGA